jgi:hypothetical protein
MVAGMEKRRFLFPGSVGVFLVLSGLEAGLIFAPAEGFSVPFWPVASSIGLCLLAALAWFSIPETIGAKRS